VNGDGNQPSLKNVKNKLGTQFSSLKTFSLLMSLGVYCLVFITASPIFLYRYTRRCTLFVQRPNPKKNMVYGTLCRI
jgi:hypothetical protein